jgi:hypothetical protein
MTCPKCGGTKTSKKGKQRGHQRYLCGSCGHKFQGLEYDPDSVALGFGIPEGEDENYAPLILPDDAYPIAVGSDAHIPYHNAESIRLFIRRAVEIKAKTVILNGDWLDCYQLSRFQRDPGMRDIPEEIALARKIFLAIRNALPYSRMIYKLGNHEGRYDTYLMRQAPELFGLKSIHLEALPELGLKSMEIEVVKNKRIIRAGHLNIVHGHEFPAGISAPVNPARGLYLRAKKSAMAGHWHQTSEHTETAINDDVVTCWSLGCLCGLHPQYMPLNKWNHGFAEITEEDGFFTVRNRRIIDGRML